MHSNWESKGKMPMNPFNELADELEYEIALMFVYTNVYGAEIYKDPLGRYTFKSAEHRTPFNETPMVNYQGDQYMGTDGARYVVTKYPDLVDALGVLQTDKVPIFEQMADSLQEHDGRSNRMNDPGTPTFHFNQHLEKLFSDWNVEKKIKVTKVFQDDPLQEVFCDSEDVYYATTKLQHL